MKEFQYTIKDEAGIHARPAGQLVKLAQQFESSITVEKDGKAVDCKRLFALMGLAAKQGESVLVRAEGPDELTAFQEIKTFVSENL